MASLTTAFLVFCLIGLSLAAQSGGKLFLGHTFSFFSVFALPLLLGGPRNCVSE